MDGAARQEIVAKAAAQLNLVPVLDEPGIAESYTKVPWARIAALGATCVGMSDAFRTVLVEAPGWYRPDFNGIVGALAQAKDGSGMLGTIINERGVAGQARWHEAVGANAVSAVMPIDPIALAMMAMLVHIDQKLDTIAALQQDMFDYLKTRDRAQLKGDLTLMGDVFKGFKCNWDNANWINNEIPRLKEIQRSAEQGIARSKDLIASKMGSKPLFHFNWDVDSATRELLELLGDYRLALHSYTFSTFLLVLLERNYGAAHLDVVVSALEQRSNDYRNWYTKCYGHIESLAGSSVESGVLGGLAFVGKAIGSAVEKTPIGDVTFIDELFLGAGDQIERCGNDQKASATSRLLASRDGGARLFVEGINSIKEICNNPVDYLVGEEGVYFKATLGA